MHVTLVQEKKCGRLNESEHVVYSSPASLGLCGCADASDTKEKQLLHTHLKSRHDSMKSLIVWRSAEDNTQDSSQSTDAH